MPRPRKPIGACPQRAPKNPANGERNGKWKGGIHIDPKGYPSYSGGSHRGRRVHVVMMEQLLGRRLRKGEEVHHMDFDKTHNWYCNFILMPAKMHAMAHAPGRMLQAQAEDREREAPPEWVTEGGDVGEGSDVGMEEAY